MLSRTITIGLVAGETSGDILGAYLIRALRYHIKYVHFVGIAGPRMQTEGMETWYAMDELEIMGIFELLKRLPRLLRIRRDITNRFTMFPIDVFIGIDYPDFNIPLEGCLKQRGISTIHYVSPSVWAWRPNRVLTIGRATDNVLVLLPFEKAFYDRFNVPCKFIGHTIADKIPLYPDKAAARRELNIVTDVHCLALLPGSRSSEVEMLSADFLRCADILIKIFPDLEILVPIVNKERRDQFKRIKAQVAPTLRVKLLDNNAHKAMIAADAALLASGTATLECMLAKCPMVVGYKLKYATFKLASWLVKTPWISLPNILAGRELVKEFLQKECNPEKLAAELTLLFKKSDKCAALIVEFRKLHKKIRCNADEQAARAVIKLLLKNKK